MVKVFFTHNYDARLSEELNCALEQISTEQGLIDLLTYSVLQSKDFSLFDHILKNRFSLLPKQDYDEQQLNNLSGEELEQLDFFGAPPAKEKKERKKRSDKVEVEEQDDLNFEDEGIVFPAVKCEKGIIEITEHLIVKCSKEIALAYFLQVNHLTNFDEQYDLLVDNLKKDSFPDISDLKLFYIADYIFDLFKK